MAVRRQANGSGRPWNERYQVHSEAFAKRRFAACDPQRRTFDVVPLQFGLCRLAAQPAYSLNGLKRRSSLEPAMADSYLSEFGERRGSYKSIGCRPTREVVQAYPSNAGSVLWNEADHNFDGAVDAGDLRE